MKVIDGFYGGQITRIAIAISSLTSIPIKVVNIRGNRPNPGLRAQHIKAVESVAALCDAEVQGLELGSKELIFVPGEIKRKKIKVDIGTAGSVSLIVQAFLLPSTIKGAKLVARGGTDVPFSPPIDYLRLVTLKTLRRFGLNAHIKVLKRGYYPRGGGIIELEVERSNFSSIELVESEKDVFEGISHATNLPGVAERMKRSALKILAGKVNVKISVENYSDEAWNKGCSIVIGGFGKGGSSLGKLGKRAEIVGMEAAKELISYLNFPLDPYMSDQILPFAAVFGGKVKIVETSHVKALLNLFSEFGIDYTYSNKVFISKGLL